MKVNRGEGWGMGQFDNNRYLHYKDPKRSPTLSESNTNSST